MKKHVYVVSIEYSNARNMHPVFVEVKRSGELIAEFGGKSRKALLSKALKRIDEEEAAE